MEYEPPFCTTPPGITRPDRMTFRSHRLSCVPVSMVLTTALMVIQHRAEGDC